MTTWSDDLLEVLRLRGIIEMVGLGQIALARGSRPESAVSKSPGNGKSRRNEGVGSV
jgi:hypothetical protein